MKQKHAQSGFTLIELVIVITILGILAAVALPRFIGLQTQARVAKAQAIYGSIKAASALAHANCLVDLAGLTTPSTCTAAAGTTSMDGIAVDMINQYPAATATGILRAAQLDNAANEGLTVTAGNPILISVVGGTAATCRISYTAAAAPAAPVIALDTSGC